MIKISALYTLCQELRAYFGLSLSSGFGIGSLRRFDSPILELNLLNWKIRFNYMANQYLSLKHRCEY